MTLLDIHPSVVAKLLIIFRLLEQAGSAKGAEEAELYMTLAGLSRCLVVPKYCAERYVTCLRLPSRYPDVYKV